MLFYELVVGNVPFAGDTAKEILASILASPLAERTNLADFFSPPAADLAAALLHNDPRKRLGVGSFSQITSHPFFAGTPWASMTSTEPPFIPVLEHAGDTSYFDEAGPELKIDPSGMSRRIGEYDSDHECDSDESDFDHICGANVDQLLALTRDAASTAAAVPVS